MDINTVSGSFKGGFRRINSHLVEQQKENAGADLLGKANYKDTRYYLSFIIKSLHEQHSCGLRIVGSYHFPVLRSPLMSSTRDLPYTIKG